MLRELAIQILDAMLLTRSSVLRSRKFSNSWSRFFIGQVSLNRVEVFHLIENLMLIFLFLADFLYVEIEPECAHKTFYYFFHDGNCGRHQKKFLACQGEKFF